jgi:hypothetical protein
MVRREGIEKQVITMLVEKELQALPSGGYNSVYNLHQCSYSFQLFLFVFVTESSYVVQPGLKLIL